MSTLDQRIAYGSLVAQLALVLKGWGSIREDGKWAAWNANEVFERAVDRATWLITPYPEPPEIDPADIGLGPDGRFLP